MQHALDLSLHFEVEQMNGMKAFCFGLYITDTIPQKLIGWDDKTLPLVLTPNLFRVGTKIEFWPEYENAVREYLRNKIDPQL
jgi:hypothetical protein